MERDMDLVREILNQVAAHPEPIGWVPLDIPGRSSDEVSYHVKILSDGGYVDADNVTTFGAFDWRAKRLTWEGHELRDALKNDTVWQRVKKVIAEKGGGASIEMVKQLAIEISKRYFMEGLS
jgi:hypothetical protein